MSDHAKAVLIAVAAAPLLAGGGMSIAAGEILNGALILWTGLMTLGMGLLRWIKDDQW